MIEDPNRAALALQLLSLILRATWSYSDESVILVEDDKTSYVTLRVGRTGHLREYGGPNLIAAIENAAKSEVGGND